MFGDFIFTTVASAASRTCALGGGSGLFQQQWVGISALIVLVAFVISAMMYALGNTLASSFREKLKQLAKAEAVQALLGLVIIFTLIAFSEITCTIGSSAAQQITGSSLAPFAFSQFYIGNLLFANGFGLVGAMYSTSIQYTTVGLVVKFFSDSLVLPFSSAATALPSLIPGAGKIGALLGGWGFSVGPSANLANLYNSYASVLSGAYTDLVIISFASLLIVFLMLPLVQYASLTLIVPLSIVMRLLPFMGPKLRDTSDTLLAIAIAFYFILPLTIVLDSYIVSWAYCIPPMTSASGSCNPYVGYLGQYTENTLVINSLLQTSTNTISNGFIGGGGYPTFTNIFTGGRFLLSGFNFQSLMQIIYAPGVVANYTNQVAQYMFQSTILIALDYVITLGFAVALMKSIARMNALFVSGPFW